jgi:hypothetical protein
MTMQPIRAARMYACLLMLLSLCSLSCVVGKRIQARDEESMIVDVNKCLWSGAEYVVLARDTTSEWVDSYFFPGVGTEKDLERRRQRILDDLRVEGLDLTPLLDALVDVNRTPVRLHMTSDRGNGYLMDHTGEYRRGSWHAFYKDHPDSLGVAEVSRPIYDEKTGILLIYVCLHRGTRAGRGSLFAFKYEGGILKKLAEAELWIS